MPVSRGNIKNFASRIYSIHISLISQNMQLKLPNNFIPIKQKLNDNIEKLIWLFISFVALKKIKKL